MQKHILFILSFSGRWQAGRFFRAR